LPESRHVTLEIRNRLGLHARAAAQFVQTASRFDAEVTVSKDDQAVNGRSIMGVMMLAAECGSSIIIRAAGMDADAAVQAIVELISTGFGEM
jgi:phosphocarrier protein HPr